MSGIANSAQRSWNIQPSKGLLEQQINLIKQGALQAQGYTRDSSFTYLGDLVTQQEFEEYDRVVSQIYLSTIAEGNYAFSDQDSATIYNIASLCPALGGKAVYKARSIYNLLNDSIYFDDDSLCVSQSVMFRQTSNNISEIQQIEFAKAYPNPTSNIFIIEFIDVIASPVTLKLRDNMGKLIEQKILNNKINTINLIESITNSGLYLYELIDDTNGRKQTGKISFIK